MCSLTPKPQPVQSADLYEQDVKLVQPAVPCGQLPAALSPAAAAAARVIEHRGTNYGFVHPRNYQPPRRQGRGVVRRHPAVDRANLSRPQAEARTATLTALSRLR